MPGDEKVIVVTGASGFLGGECCRHFCQQGYSVRALVRSPEEVGEPLRRHAAGGIYRCELPDFIDEAALQGPIDALIHCAFATQGEGRQRAEAVDVEGSQNLLRAAGRADVKRFVFISSFSSHPDAESHYGRSKWRVESMLDEERDLIVRAGLIIGAGGLFQRMREALRRSRLIPLFYGGRQQIQTVWVGDLCVALERALINETVGTLRIAAAEATPIREFYRRLATVEGRSCIFLPLPGGPALLLLRFLESFGLQLPVTSENLLGLKKIGQVDVTSDLDRLGIQPRSLEQSLALLEA
jgi:nucleoside-diphosphate-sugar epimerase